MTESYAEDRFGPMTESYLDDIFLLVTVLTQTLARFPRGSPDGLRPIKALLGSDLRGRELRI